MKPFDALRQAHLSLAGLKSQLLTRNLLVGISGCVAVGKTRFTRRLVSGIEDLFQLKVNWLAFDYWVNFQNLGSPTYAGRFYLEEFTAALRSIREGTHFMVPRFDLMKVHGLAQGLTQVALQQVIWNGKTYTRYLGFAGAPGPAGSDGLFVEDSTGRLFSYMPAAIGRVYVMDGTMVFPKESVGLYDCKLFVEASWPWRLARMIRRYNREEVFGTTTQTLVEYVGFLVDEAQACADAEVLDQRTSDMIVIDHYPTALANYFDLALLQEMLEKKIVPDHWIEPMDITMAMTAFRQDLMGEVDPHRLRELRAEFAHLAEVQHHFDLRDRKLIFRQLSQILLQ